MFTDNDLAQFAKQGVTRNEVEQQIKNFITGFPFLDIVAPATPNKGIVQLTNNEQQHYTEYYDQWDGSRIKFVPASGAATRMFKALFEAMAKLDNHQPIDWSEKAMRPVKEFFDRLPEFAFYVRLEKHLALQGIDIKHLTEKDYGAVLHTLLDPQGFNYGAMPKGLILFHKYENQEVRTAFEEHLMEAALYANNSNRTAQLHFTVSPEHHTGFEQLFHDVDDDYEKRYGVRYTMDLSEQKKSTDTIAVDTDNKPLRDTDGSILFRPGGHGALLENLNELNANIIFIKNIDNIVPERHVAETVRWKKILAGVLLERQEQVFRYLHKLDEGAQNEAVLSEIEDFLQKTFCITLPKNLDKATRQSYLYNTLNRPIRVCGMVKNVGEPGGGPFIARNADESLSLQIAEAQQIDVNDEQQSAMLQAATHFNPVDLVCAPINYKGQKFDLLQYRDPATGFISLKSKDGKDLKAQELPGLWNGAMSRWNTIFVETPLITFNPVKTINDLLRPEHQ